MINRYAVRWLLLVPIANTKTTTGLEVRSVLDENEYQKGRKLSDEEIATLNICGDIFHPEWNYSISPR